MDAQAGAPEKGDTKTLEPIVSHEHGTADSIRNLPLAVDTNLRLVDEAIEAIGFGRFQIQLTLTSGFGFLVDQVCSIKARFHSNTALRSVSYDVWPPLDDLSCYQPSHSAIGDGIRTAIPDFAIRLELRRPLRRCDHTRRIRR